MELRKAAGWVATQFDIPGVVTDLQAYGSGHIHSTFKVVSESKLSGPASFLLQKINTSIFPFPHRMTENLEVVNAHLSKKAYRYRPLEAQPNRQGDYWVEHQGAIWRMFPFIENTYSPNRPTTAAQAEAGAQAFGHFLACLRDLPTEQLQVTLPDFTNGQLRWQQFEQAVQQGNQERKSIARKTITWLYEQYSLLSHFQWSDFPQRATHHDTKINNLLFDCDYQTCVAVIDLDTLMPGSWLYDFGDMVRTFCCSESEESKKLDQVFIRRDWYDAVKKGWLSEVGEWLTPIERERLLEGALWVIYIQALRFLSDYLMGDPYYKIHYADQNHYRARNQVALLQSLLKIRKEESTKK